MIQKLIIRNFKSIRELDLDCRRVNVFIGEPNAGKTNILEALGLWCPGVHTELRKVCRAEYVSELFFDQSTEEPIDVDLGKAGLQVIKCEGGANLCFPEPWPAPEHEDCVEHVLLNDNLTSKLQRQRYRVDGPKVKYFIYNANAPVDDVANGGLAAPFGSNLASLLANDKNARQIAADYYFDSRYRLTVDVGKRHLSMSRQEDSAVVSFPYTATSETLRRMIFYRLALETSRECILAFDEPEANSYPPYTKILAESIAKDGQENQFFLTTHSPYMLTSIIAKTPPEELNVFVCRLEDSETKVYPMNEDQRQDLMEMDMSAFFNLDRFLPDLP
jgi:predicted ATPase